MKIKEILIESFRSRFFNLLAIANLTMVAWIKSYGTVRTGSSVNIVTSLNLPAIALSWSMDSVALIPPFIYLQWILIGAFAKFVAFHARPRNNYTV